MDVPLDTRKCSTCGKQFTHNRGLARHLERVKPCVATPGKFICLCEKVYHLKSSLHRHQRHCAAYQQSIGAAAPGVSIVDRTANIDRIQGTGNVGGSATVGVVTNHINVTNNITNVVADQVGVLSNGFASAPKKLAHPGWPASWPVPRVTPVPFTPLKFALSLDQLLAAMAACSPPQLEACRRGDPAATASLMIELVRQVHTDPLERNVYINPRRADQALVFDSECWLTIELIHATLRILGRAAEELGELGSQQKASPMVRETARAAISNYGAQASRVAASSLRPMSAHLENMRQQAISGDDWLGIPPTAEGKQPQCFGAERQGHLVADGVVANLELALHLYGLDQITPDTAKSYSEQALSRFAQLMLHNHPENLSILLGPADQVYVNTRRGWALRPRAEVSREQARAMLDRLIEFLSYASNQSPVRGLLPYLKEAADEIVDSVGRADGEIVCRYLAAASQYYEGLPDIAAAPSDERYQARSLLLRLREPPDNTTELVAEKVKQSTAEAPHPVILELPPALVQWPSEEIAADAPIVLTEEDLDDLLGYK